MTQKSRENKRLEKQQTMHCFVKPICYWNEEQWKQVKVFGSLLLTGAIWEKFTISLLHLWNGPVSSKQGNSSILLRALLVTAATPVLGRAQDGNVHILVELVLHTSPAAWHIGILSGVTALFSCSKTSPKGNGPSQPESKPTEHVGPNPIEYFYFYWLFKSTKIMYLMFVSCIILMSGYLVPC